jgi:NAD(P)-dependent dehydrogenase (short-subunit alcohol dehydrogenase family)
MDTAIAEWSRILDVNLTGALRMCQAAFPLLRESSAASVVNIVSTHALRPAEDVAAYAVSKAGLMHLTRILALEWAPDGIRVNGVAPSIVATAMTADLMVDRAEFDRRVARIPLGRAIAADDVAEAVAFLASSHATMITGEILTVDGGELIGRARMTGHRPG